MVDHPVQARVAEIVVARATGDTRAGGYLVSPGWVLTACHVVEGAVSIGVWLGAPSRLAPEAGSDVDISQVLTIPAADLALLPININDPSCDLALLGRLERNPEPLVPAAVVGCPRFKLRPAPDRPDVLLRDLHYAIGKIAPLSDAKANRYEFAVEVVPGPDPEAEHSPWEGMSGAAVWSGGRLIGVIGQHYPREGLGILTVRPVENIFSHASETELKAWFTALPQLPPTPEDLRLVTPPTVRKIEVARARRAAEAVSPAVLIGRGAELAALDDFIDSGKRWLWIQGDAFAGKSALLAWFALHPPDHVDVVACFLRRTTGENTADYALDVLTRQVALLINPNQSGYRPPQSPSERANDFVDLLDEASRACRERSHRLLVLVDGLDEYDPTITSLDLAAWLPAESTLPSEAMLVVASRAGVDVRVPVTHPLRNYVNHITASEAATEIRHVARAELERALMTPSGFIFPLVCCLSIADSGLTARELSALLKRRGRDADVGEIEALLDNSLGRSLVRLPNLDGVGRQVYAFAHDSLLAEARALLVDDLSLYEDLFDAWAGDYVQLDWPIGTPRYLLHPYTRELARRARNADSKSRCTAAIDQLFKVVANRSRLQRLFERTGNPAMPNREIAAAQRTIVDTRKCIDLDEDEVIFRLAVLALRRTPVTGAKADVAKRIAAVWAHTGRIYDAVDLAVGIDDLERRSVALGEVAVALASAGQVDAALQAVAEISDWERQAVALGEVAVALASAGQPKQAADVAELALQAITDIYVPEQRTKALSTVAVALASAGQAERALRVIGDIPPWQQGEALSEAAVALARAGMDWQALQVVDGIADREQWAMALAEVAVALAAAGHVGQALQVSASIKSPWRQAEALSEAAVALAAAGDTGQAADVARQARQAATRIKSLWRRARVRSAVAVALAAAGETGQAVDVADQALQAASELADPEQQAEALSEVAAALAATGRAGQAADVAGQALQAATRIQNQWQRAEALGKAAMALAAAGETGQTVDVVGQALQAVAEIDAEQRAEALSETAAAIATAGLFGQAADVAEQALQAVVGIDDPEQQAEALGKAAMALAAAGETEQAADVAGQALQAAMRIRTSGERTVTLGKIAVVLASTGRLEQALQAVVGIDDPGQAEALGNVAVALAGAGQAGQALQAAAGIDDAGRRVAALAEVAVALAGAGQAGQALQAVAEIDVPWWRAEALGEVAVALAKAGQMEQAANVARQALQIVISIQDMWWRAKALSEVAVAMAKAGQIGQAASVAGQALQAAARIRSPWRRADVLGKAAVALAAAGEADRAADVGGQALQAAAGIRNHWWRMDALSELAVALTGSGHADLALQAAADIDDRQRRSEVLTKVALALASAGQAAQARQAVAEISIPKRQAKALGEVAVALARFGQPDLALQSVADIDDRQRRSEALSGVAIAVAAAGQASPALQAAVGIDELQPRSLALIALLPNFALPSGTDHEVGRKALELLLLMPNAADHLAAFPVPLLQRLVEDGELEVDEC